MYAQFFGLKQEPFSIAPDPRYLFMSRRHREALAHLLYGVEGGGGFVLLSGEIGAGKTTVCRCFLEQIPKRCNVAYIFNPKLTVLELLKSICEEFGIPVKAEASGVATVKDYIDPLNEFLLKTHAVGQNNVLIIDEAQMLSADVLEQLRLLTNLETSERKLLQIVLIGQPELRTLLARPELEQLAQRVIARFHLKALSDSETAQYIRHRLAVAGLTRGIPFDREAIERVHVLARGIPRRINLLCDRAMLGAYARGTHRIDREIVDRAAVEVFGRSERPASGRAGPRRFAWLVAGVAAVAAAAVYAGIVLVGDRTSREAPPSPAASVPTATAGASAAAAAERSAPASARAAHGAASPASSAASAKAVLVSPLAAPLNDATPPGATDAIAAASAVAKAPALFLTGADLKTAFPSVVHDEKTAWRELATLWNLDLGSDADPCTEVLQKQVRCYKSGSSIEFVRRLARPGIVELHDDAKQPVYPLLTGLTEHEATLQMAGVARTVSLVSFAKLWNGTFATLWRMPPGYAAPLGAGATGPAVDHLGAALAQAAGASAPSGKQTMDAALRAQVARFQAEHGIKAVGTAGPTTFMQLNHAAGVDEPWLRLQSR